MPENILVINMLHIGDLLLATPVLRALRAKHPKARLTLLADAKIDGLVRFNQHIDELISVDKKGYHNKLGNFLSLIGDIRRRKFDLVINLHPNERASALAAFSGAKRIIGYSSPGFGWFFDTLIKNKNFDHGMKNDPDIPHQATEHLLMLETVLGISPTDAGGLEMWLDDETETWAAKRWGQAFGKYPPKVIGFNTGASWPTKRWTTDGFAAVADELLESGYGVAFFGGPMDVENVREIRSKMKNPWHQRIVEFTGKLTLLELGGLIRHCAVFLTNDSGPMHVAVAQKANVVAVFGSSNEVGFGPYDLERSVVITAPEIACRPCGQHLCDHHSCMKAISPTRVVSEVKRMAGEPANDKRPAVFFDRDGVLNVDTGYVFRPTDFTWRSGAKEAIRLCNDSGYHVFVVTNQSGVARGYYTEADVRALHDWMNQELASFGAHIDGFYHCPHHPDVGMGEYRVDCDCRKPNPGMIQKAMNEWDVEPSGSLLIGDKPSDVEAANKAGLKGFLYSEEEADDLAAFVAKILNR